VAIAVIYDRLQGRVRPNARMREEKPSGVVTSLRKWGESLLTPTQVLPSDGGLRGSFNTVAKYAIDSELLS
jgi:hypothetical protein